MKLFKKRKKGFESRTYSITEALNFFKKKGREDYTLLEVSNGQFRIIPIEESRKLENQMRIESKAKNSFYDNISANGSYRGITVNENEIFKYNNYQNVRG